MAVVSPNKNAYSETFIKAHRELLDADVRYYSDGFIPRVLDCQGPLSSNALPWLLRQRLRRRLYGSQLSLDELALLDSFDQQKVDVVLAEYGMTGAALVPVCRRAGLPLIVHFHGRDATVQSILDSHRDSYAVLFEYASAVVAVSRDMEKRLIALGCPKDKLIYNPYGPRDEFFEIKPRNSASPMFIAVGRFVDKKAPFNILFAFKRVLERHVNARLVMVGTGPLWFACQVLTERLQLQHAVSLPGAVEPARVRDLFAGALAFVQHSVTGPDGDMEGTPVAVLEAGAAGLPIIATRHAGIADVVVEGETGYLVDEHDVDGMAADMSRLLEQPGLAHKMGTAGRLRIREKFTMARHIGCLDQCIIDVIGN
ncbi:glycosyltransferase [Thiocapsa imhoffii]|uniref:glycosyltransferase n=1 Tax=Thiocapsa imhoffii TaxID=382777 RepID=UPI0019074CD9